MTGPRFDPEAARLWLRILHQGNPGRIHIAATGAWAGPSFETTEAGIDAAVSRIADLDAARSLGIYVRMATLLRPLRRGDRGANADSLTLPALWADLDIAGPAHKDAGLPPDWAAVERIVAGSGLPSPSVWIDSGHGAYPIWLLDPPEVLTADTITGAAKLCADWQKVIGAASRRLGFSYGEGVGDLARVLRIPGTINRKAGTERLCRLTGAGTGLGYTLANLQRHCTEALPAAEPAPRPVTQYSPFQPATPRTATSELTPGDDWAARTSWAEILEPHGWRLTRMRGDIGDWCRPGKDDGISATTNGLGTDRFHNFSTSSGFDVGSYSKLGVLAVLEHGGDRSAAASALRYRGFGGDAVADYLAGLIPSLPPLPPRESLTVRSGTEPMEVDEVTAAALNGQDQPAPPSVDTQPEVLDARTLAELRYRQEVAAEVRRQQVTKEARKQVTSLEFASTWEEPPSFHTLTEELALPDDPIRYRIGKALTMEGNAVLTAAFKAGKTTLCNNLLRSLADGDPFLGRFDVVIPEGRTASWNYEVAEGQYRGWLRNIGIVDTDRLCLLNLRGRRLPLTDPQIEDWIVKWLIDRHVKVWIVDPFARAMVGSGDENSNTDVGVMLDTLDVIKRRAGVGELILPTHTGRAEMSAGTERARGATRLDDWADARWLLTADDQARRFFRATGRDVDVDEELLSFDKGTGRLVMGGHDRRGMAVRDNTAELVDWVREHPGLGVEEIVAGLGRRKKTVSDGLASAVASRALYVVQPGGNKKLHYAAGAVPEVTDDDR